ncbi:MAG: hypothetical protein EA415_13875 [Sphaerobacteraceae bacterium]|nr:MAG: hypothetical protein EA415_13875 [Sphaerobacteraceae bacterium]
MRLEHFSLRGFAQHDAVDLTFRHGQPDLIIGPNEAGKSHLMTALTGTIFGILDPERYRPWHGPPTMLGRLDLTANDQQIRIERHFLEQQVIVHINGEQVFHGRGLVERNTAEDERYRSMLQEWIGFAEHDVFLRTVFISQDGLQDGRLNGLSAQIKRLISGTREASYETAIADLEAELDTLIKLPRKRTNRRKEDLEAQIQDLRERHAAAETIQRQVVDLIEEERLLHAQQAEAKQTKERYADLAQNASDLQKAIAEENQKRFAWSELEQQLGRLESDQERRAKLEAARDELRIPDDPDPGEIGDLARDIERLDMRIESLSEDAERNQSLQEQRDFLIQELEKHRIPGDVDPGDVREIGFHTEQAARAVDELRSRRERTLRQQQAAAPRPAPDNTPKLLRTAAGVIAVGSIGLGIVVDPLLFAGVVVAIALIAIGIMMTRSSARPDTEPVDDPAIAAIDAELQRAEEILALYQRQQDQLLAESGVDTLDDLYRRAREFQANLSRLDAQPQIDDQPAIDLEAAQSKRRELQERRDTLLQQSGESDLEALQTRASRYRETLRLLEQIDPLDPEEIARRREQLTTVQQDTAIARQTAQRLRSDYPELHKIEPEQVRAYQQTVQRAEETIQESERRLYQIGLDRQHLARSSEDAGDLQARIRELEEELNQVNLTAHAHIVAIETLRDSVTAFQEHALDPVGEQAGELFARLTDGRYQIVELDRESMIPTISGNGIPEIDKQQLSRGAGDQLYLAIRASLIEALSGDRTLPMLLDDPCVNFDEERLANAAELITRLAQDRQILIFTKDETWTRWISPSLRLERRTDPSVSEIGWSDQE